MSLVPVLELPLQAILHFQPCPVPLAASYLQSLCSTEGHSVQRQVALEPYLSTRADDLADVWDLPPCSASGNLKVPDLRQAINHLQFQCSSIEASSTSHATASRPLPADSLGELPEWNWPMVSAGSVEDVSSTLGSGRHLVAALSELASFMDSHLMRSAWDRPAVSGLTTQAKL
jgi:hypothetical protein